MSEIDGASMALLVSMGFDERTATEALKKSKGNVEEAVSCLLGGGGGNAGGGGEGRASSSSSSSAMMMHGPISQYSMANGRSACTCIALCGATKFLHQVDSLQPRQQQQQQKQPNKNAASSTPSSTVLSNLTGEFLQNMILSGCTKYEEIQKQQRSTTGAGVEHMSAEEVMSLGHFGELQVITNYDDRGSSGGVRQGILSNNDDDSHPQGLRRMLADCQHHGIMNGNRWICILMTKTPETVLICIPTVWRTTRNARSVTRNNSGSSRGPSRMSLHRNYVIGNVVTEDDSTYNDDYDDGFFTNDDSTTQQQQQHYILIDSHPRPQHFFDTGGQVADSSYIRIHSTFDDLIDSLRTIFPTTNLGSDVSDIMSTMYNSFDLYPLQLKNK